MAVNIIHLWCWNFLSQVAPEFVYCEALNIMKQYHDDENDDGNDDHHDDDETIPGCLM